MTKYIQITIAALLILAGCGPQPTPPAPTVFQLPTSDPALAANIPNTPPTATRSVPTLPPTFTPSLPPSATATEVVATATTTPVGFNTAGTIYFIFNGDSIAALAADGSKEELIAVGGPYSDLTASPDNALLAYVAPGAGSAREVYISSRDGTYVQRISCLGMADVRQPAWSPDGTMLAWVAAPAPGAAADVYVATVAGSGRCPTDNGQRVIAAAATTTVNSPAWNNTMDSFFYGNGTVFGKNPAGSGEIQLSLPSGFGSDFGLAHNPVHAELAFLRPILDQRTNTRTSQLIFIDTSLLFELPGERAFGIFLADSLQWSRDGRYLLVGTRDTVYAFDTNLNSSLTVASEIRFPPNATFSPDGQQVAYVDADPNNLVLPQIFVTGISDRAPRQITTHTEGVIIDLVWLEG